MTTLTFHGPAAAAARTLIQGTSLAGYLDRAWDDTGAVLTVDPAKFPHYRPSRGEEALLGVLYAFSGRVASWNHADVAMYVDAEARAVVVQALAVAWQLPTVPLQRAVAS